MAPPNERLPEHDEQAFREAVVDAVPLPPSGRAVLTPPPPQPFPFQTLKDEREALSESLAPSISGAETGEELNFLRPGLPRQILKKLQRGHWVIQDQLDLHGLNREQAKEMLSEFLRRCRRRGVRCVRVIHGKGLRSPNGEPVLKRSVGLWLRQREEVLGFCQARPQDGGGGAAVVLLKG